MIAASRVEDNGLVKNHDYSLIEIHEIIYKGQNLRLLKLRNPWGKVEWKGDWSDSSRLWTPELRQMLGCDVADDGFFFMTYKDFLQNFDGISICVVNDPSYKHSQTFHNFVDSEPSQVFFKFTLPRMIDLDLNVFAISVC